MHKFYFQLWIRWIVRVVTCSVVSAGVIAAIATVVIYIRKGLPALDNAVVGALGDIFVFWFALFLNITIIFALFRSSKYLFNRCYSGYSLKLMQCGTKEYIDPVGYGDLVKFWRKWLMLLVWLSGAQMIVAVVISYAIDANISLFDWFSVYILYLFIVISGYISFVLIGQRCKQVSVVRC